jgi:hypothetical protein
MGISEHDVTSALQQSQMFNVVNFETMMYEREMEEMEPASRHDPSQIVEDQEMNDTLRQAIGTLPEKERMVIVLHYYEGLTMKSIAKILGVSESRVSQIHSRTLLKMRRTIGSIRGGSRWTRERSPDCLPPDRNRNCCRPQRSGLAVRRQSCIAWITVRRSAIGRTAVFCPEQDWQNYSNMDAQAKLCYQPDGVYLDLIPAQGSGRPLDRTRLTEYVARKSLNGLARSPSKN